MDRGDLFEQVVSSLRRGVGLAEPAERQGQHVPHAVQRAQLLAAEPPAGARDHEGVGGLLTEGNRHGGAHANFGDIEEPPPASGQLDDVLARSLTGGEPQRDDDRTV